MGDGGKLHLFLERNDLWSAHIGSTSAKGGYAGLSSRDLLSRDTPSGIEMSGGWCATRFRSVGVSEENLQKKHFSSRFSSERFLQIFTSLHSCFLFAFVLVGCRPHTRQKLFTNLFNFGFLSIFTAIFWKVDRQTRFLRHLTLKKSKRLQHKQKNRGVSGWTGTGDGWQLQKKAGFSAEKKQTKNQKRGVGAEKRGVGAEAEPKLNFSHQHRQSENSKARLRTKPDIKILTIVDGI